MTRVAKRLIQGRLLPFFVAGSVLLHIFAVFFFGHYQGQAADEYIPVELFMPSFQESASMPARAVEDEKATETQPQMRDTPAVQQEHEPPADQRDVVQAKEQDDIHAARETALPVKSPRVLKHLQASAIPPETSDGEPDPSRKDIQVGEPDHEVAPDNDAMVMPAAPGKKIASSVQQQGSGRSAVSNPHPAATDVFKAYLAELKKKIEAAKRYPRAAKLRKLEGIIMIKFTIRDDGSVSGVAVDSRSTSSRILERAAQNAVVRAAPFPTPPEGTLSCPFEVTVPIEFRFVD